jgi:hypothetical protein
MLENFNTSVSTSCCAAWIANKFVALPVNQTSKSGLIGCSNTLLEVSAASQLSKE